MAVLEIIGPENPILRKRAHKVTSFNDKKFQKLVDDMIETMVDAKGIGLAAPQVAHSLRLIVIRLPGETEEDREEYGEGAGETYIVANPKIIKSSRGMVAGTEGCLSLPGLFGEVDRHESIVVTGQDRDGGKIRIKSKGWLARVFQHEIDHLDGRLFTDLTDNIWRPSEEDDLEEAEIEVASDDMPESEDATPTPE